jgi:DNA-binding NarL/FixJ family response regulator
MFLCPYFTIKQCAKDSGVLMPNLLIVDDSALFRETLSAILLSHFPGIRVGGAADGKEALEKTESQHPELIFMDVKLPGENGFVLTREIKAVHPGIAIIIITSYDSLEYREAAAQSGADLFISKKTSTSTEIISVVKSTLSSRGVNLDEK